MHLLAHDRAHRILHLAAAAPLGDETPPCFEAANDTDLDPPPRPAASAARPMPWQHVQLAA